MASITCTSGTVSAIESGLVLKGIAAETLGVGAPVKFGVSGLVELAVSTEWLATGTGGQCDFDGIVIQRYVANDAVTVYGKGCVIGNFAAGMTAGQALWIDSVPGSLSNVPVAAAGTDELVAKAISTVDILVKR